MPSNDEIMLSQIVKGAMSRGYIFCANVITYIVPLLVHKMDLWRYKEYINAANSISREHCP